MLRPRTTEDIQNMRFGIEAAFLGQSTDRTQDYLVRHSQKTQGSTERGNGR